MSLIQLRWEGDFITVSFACVHTYIHMCVCVYSCIYLRALYLGRYCQFLQLCLFPYQVLIFVSSLCCLFFQKLSSYVRVSVMSSSFQVSWQNHCFLHVLFRDLCCILPAGRYIKISTFCMAFLCGLYYFSIQLEISSEEELCSVQ